MNEYWVVVYFGKVVFVSKFRSLSDDHFKVLCREYYGDFQIQGNQKLLSVKGKPPNITMYLVDDEVDFKKALKRAINAKSSHEGLKPKAARNES